MWRGIFGASVKLQNTLLPSELVGINVIVSQTVRWKARKPSWLPPGKTKLFRIHPRRRTPPEEEKEIFRLYNHYRTCRKSIREHLIKIVAANQVQYNEENVKKNIEIEFESCKEINDEWNKQIALVREERLNKEWKEKQVVILRRLEERQAIDAKEKTVAEEYIRKVKQDVTTFITKETIDQAIAEALENVVNYNEAIDSKGNRYHDIIEKKELRIKQ